MTGIANMADPKQQLHEAAGAIQAATQLLGPHLDLMRRFLKETRDMDSFGHVVDPTLWKKSERRAANAFVEPLFRAALAFNEAVDKQRNAALVALAKVNANG